MNTELTPTSAPELAPTEPPIAPLSGAYASGSNELNVDTPVMAFAQLQLAAPIARAVADSSGFSIAGGGDTLAAIAKYGIEKDVDYISTGGGAFLEVLEGKTLPAFEILEKRAAG